MGGRWWVVGGGWWVVGEPRPVAARNPHHLPPTTYHPLPVLLLLATLGAFGCSSSPPRAPAIAEAYAGPATLPLRKDIPLQVAGGGHRKTRRAARNRTAPPPLHEGAHGARRRRLDRGLPASQRRRNRGTEASGAPRVDHAVAGRGQHLRTAERTYRAESLFAQLPANQRRRKGGCAGARERATHAAGTEGVDSSPAETGAGPETRRGEVSAAAPAYSSPPPKNWKELSRTPPEIAQEIAADRAAHAPPNDDWSLVRNSQGESGWVLTRRLYMAIPDEVAQYAEGHRITSYFPLTDVQDGDTVKHNWLWTTSAGGDHPYDFDSYRVFTWSLRRHRYETAFIQRNVEGYFPVLARPAGFSVCVVNGAGQRVRRSYSFIATTVRFTGDQPCEAPGTLPTLGVAEAGSPQPAASPAAGKPSFWGRLKTRIGRWFAR